MNDTALIILSLIAGGVITFLISYLFYRKTIYTKLGVYINFVSQVISNIDDPHIKNDVEIRFRDEPLTDLLQVQFIIANDGQRPIRGIVEPLHLVLPEDVRLLESQVIHVQPPGREVDVNTETTSDGKTKIVFDFKLLNKGEFFLTKHLIDGNLDLDTLKLKVTAEDIEPLIKPVKEPFGKNTEEIEGGLAITTGLIHFAVLAANIFAILQIAKLYPSVWIKNDNFSILSLEFAGVALIFAFSLYLFGRGLYFLFARGIFNPKPKFKIPHKLKNTNYYSSFNYSHKYIQSHRKEILDIINDPTLSDDQKHQRLDSYVGNMEAALRDHH